MEAPNTQDKELSEKWKPFNILADMFQHCEPLFV